MPIQPLESGPCGGDGPTGPTGPAGPAGATGPVGPTGPSGASGGFYEHQQGTPSAVWTIDHNLGFNPNVTVQDSAGTTVQGEVNYVTSNQVVITFSAAFSGVAYLS